MPKVAELRMIDGALWARVDVDFKKDEPISLLTEPEVQAIRKDERNGCIEVISWYRNVSNFTADDIIKRIRSANGQQLDR